MATPSSLISEAAVLTLRSRTKKLADNVGKNNALLGRLEEKGRIKLVSGGREIIQEIEFAENGTYKRYSGYEQLNVAPSEVFTAATYNYAQVAVAISISGLEMLQNSGKEAVIDLLDARISNAEKTIRNGIALDIYSDGSADGGRQIGGLQLLVADSPATGTVGGINRALYPFWRNISFDATTDGGAAATTANIQDYMHRVWLQTVRGTDRTDLICSDANYYRLYWGSLTPLQRFTSPKMAELGFQSLKYQDADVVLDGGVGGGCPTNHMYFLNTDYIHWRPHADRNFEVLQPDRFGVNQDAMVKLIAWAGNMTLSNAFLQGVLKD
jgi:hypothetical protein